MQKPASSGVEDGASTEALRKVRVPFVRRVSVHHRGSTEESFSVDLGLRGVFVERSEPLPRGEAMDVAFLLPGNAIPFRASCRVAWSQASGAPGVAAAPGGLGLEFVEVSSWDQERLRDFLLEHLRRDAGRRFHPHWPEEAGEEEGARGDDDP